MYSYESELGRAAVDSIVAIVTAVNGVVWGSPMLVLILGTGFFLMLGIRFMPLRRVGYGFRMLWEGRTEHGKGDITPFNALMTSLSATIGTGNIAGVATCFAEYFKAGCQKRPGSCP